jgi:Leucine-rich repeat (LRR) protein
MAFLVLLLLACSVLPFPPLLLLVAAVDEKAALEALYDGTGGDYWINNTDWKSSSKPYCNWHGVVCGGANTVGVTSITLNQNNLNGEIPPSFWTLPQLTHAQFRGNSITNAGFTGISSSCPIEVVVFSENDLTDLTGIGNAKATLKNLNLNKNQLDKALPDEFFDLTNLETVYLAFNQIQGSLPTLIGKLSKLTELYAFSNQFTGSIPSEIGLLDVCQILGLGNNDFTGHLPSEINRMANMRDLSVHHTREVGDASPNDHPGLSGPLPTFGDMPYLTLLFLDGNSLTGTIPTDFLRHNENTNVPISIGLANNMFTGALPKSLERFQSLSIDLAGNSISEIPTELCDLGGWMGGLVQKYKCDAILCPIQTYNKEGRASSDSSLCQPCTDGYEFLGAQTCSSDPSEQEPWQILAGFYLAMGGDQWTIATGWDTLNAVLATATDEDLPTLTVDICTGWYGVVCENGQVTQISLPKNDLFGTVPDSIFQLKTLRMFDVSGNNVQMSDFHAAAKAQALTTLVLSDIKLKSFDGIGDIPNLHLLYLDGIDNAEPMPSELFQLTDLKILHLQHGSFTGTLPTLVGQLSSLEVYVLPCCGSVAITSFSRASCFH